MTRVACHCQGARQCKGASPQAQAQAHGESQPVFDIRRVHRVQVGGGQASFYSPYKSDGKPPNFPIIFPSSFPPPYLFLHPLECPISRGLFLNTRSIEMQQKSKAPRMLSAV
eukprot:EG_transcript_16473